MKKPSYATWVGWRLFLLIGIAAPCFLSLARSAAARAHGTDQSGIQVDVNLVLVDATVKNKAGEIMDNLTKDDFELREDGVAQKIALFSRDQLPLNLALVLDCERFDRSFSGTAPGGCEHYPGSLLKPSDEVALFTFSTDAELRVPLTKDKNKIAEEIASFQATGATNINDGIFAASEYLLKTNPMGRRVIILISDDVGTSAGGQGTRDIVTETIAADASLYNLKIPGYNPPATLFYAAMQPGLVDIRKVMDQTGGEIFDVKAVSALDATFAALLQRIKTRYTLGYYTSANGAEGKPHRIRREAEVFVWEEN